MIIINIIIVVAITTITVNKGGSVLTMLGKSAMLAVQVVGMASNTPAQAIAAEDYQRGHVRIATAVRSFA